MLRFSQRAVTASHWQRLLPSTRYSSTTPSSASPAAAPSARAARLRLGAQQDGAQVVQALRVANSLSLAQVQRLLGAQSMFARAPLLAELQSAALRLRLREHEAHVNQVGFELLWAAHRILVWDGVHLGNLQYPLSSWC